MPARSDTVVMRTEALTKIYNGEVKAVDGLTTRVIPTSGKAYVGGIDVVEHATAAKQVIGVVPQSNTLDRSLNVWENLYFHGRFFGMSAKTAKTEATRLLEQFRLTERASAPVAALSGGMAQRLMVARAIMHRPATLFLDEPTAGLDPQSRLALWEILGELHAEGQTILLTTHYMEEADELCDRLAIIDHGHLLALGTPEELKKATGADTIVTVIAQGDLDALAEIFRREVPGIESVTRVDSHLLLATQAQSGLLPTVFGIADSHGFDVSDVSISEPSLETVFINLTGKDLRE